MASNAESDSHAQVRAQLQSTRGETLDIMIPPSCTVGDVRDFLVREYGYPSATRIMYSNSFIDDTSLICEFPFGSLVIVTPEGHAGTFSSMMSPSPQQQSRASPVAMGSGRQPSPQEKAGGTAAWPGETWNSPGSHTGNHTKNSPGSHTGNHTKNSPGSHTGNHTKNSAGSHTGNHTKNSAGSNTVNNRRNSSGSNTGNNPRNNTGNTGTEDNTGNSEADTRGESPSSVPSQIPQLNVESLRGVPAPELTHISRTPAATPHSRRSTSIVMRCVAPMLKKTVRVDLTEDATVADLHLALAAKEPLLGGGKLSFRGRVLDQLEVKLSACGIRAGDVNTPSVIKTNPDENGEYTVFFSSGKFDELQMALLQEIETDVAFVESLLQKTEPTMQQRRGYYEELMRILFRTDNLQGLDDEWRARRKETVKKITELQDRLKVSEEVN